MRLVLTHGDSLAEQNRSLEMSPVSVKEASNWSIGLADHMYSTDNISLPSNSVAASGTLYP